MYIVKFYMDGIKELEIFDQFTAAKNNFAGKIKKILEDDIYYYEEYLKESTEKFLKEIDKLNNFKNLKTIKDSFLDFFDEDWLIINSDSNKISLVNLDSDSFVEIIKLDDVKINEDCKDQIIKILKQVC